MDSLCESVPLSYIAWRLNYVLLQVARLKLCLLSQDMSSLSHLFAKFAGIPCRGKAMETIF